MKLHTLEEVVTVWGLHETMRDPVRWLARQIRTGKVTARKVGRSYFMSDDDITAALDAFATRTRPHSVEHRGLSAASLRRRAS